MILFFDTETTGLRPGRIIQLSYIMQKDNGFVAKNFYFGVDYIEPSAIEVHGITVEKLKKLAGDNTFSTNIDEIADDFSSADLIVAHNVQFDLRFMIAEFSYQDRRFRYRESLDTMKFFTPIMKIERESHRGYKYPKLAEMSAFLDIYPYDITRFTAKVFGENEGAFHDARYDTATLALCFNEGAKRYEKLKEIADIYL